MRRQLPLFATVIFVVALSIARAQAPNYDSIRDSIRYTTDRICSVIADKGRASSTDARSAAINIELGRLAERLAQAGVVNDTRLRVITDDRYQHMLREDFASTSPSAEACKFEVFQRLSTLVDHLVNIPSQLQPTRDTLFFPIGPSRDFRDSIKYTADRICSVIADKGRASSMDARSAAINIELGRLAERFAQAGVIITVDRYQNMLRGDFASTSPSAEACKFRVFQRLSSLVDISGPSGEVVRAYTFRNFLGTISGDEMICRAIGSLFEATPPASGCARPITNERKTVSYRVTVTDTAAKVYEIEVLGKSLELALKEPHWVERHRFYVALGFDG
jgi:hypothetical protein